MPAIANVDLSDSADIDGLLSGVRWASGALTYAFPLSGAAYGADYSPDLEPVTFLPMNSAQKAAVGVALGQFTGVAGLTFTEANSSTATLRYGLSSAPDPAWAYYPSDDAQGQGGDVWLNRHDFKNPVLGSYEWSTILHETGHALGLKHGHEAEEGFPALPAGQDSLEYTVMTYRGYIADPIQGGYTLEDGGYPQSLMMLDIAALQYIYGANFDTNREDSVYSWSPTSGQMFVNGVGGLVPLANRVFTTVWDGGGVDTYDFSNYATKLNVNLSPGVWTTMSNAQLAHLDGSLLAVGNVANALLYNGDVRSLIENAVGGAGDDMIQGNQAGNRLEGGGGVDTLIGGLGNDTLIGGARADFLIGGEGADIYYVDDAFDLVDEDVVFAGHGHGGVDTIVSTANWYWDVYSIGERMLIAENASDPLGAGATVIGSVFSNEMDGNTKNNVLFGRGGADTYRAGDGVDFISLSLLGLTDQNAYVGVDGSNTIIIDERTSGPSSYDVIFEFEPGKDRIDVSSYGYRAPSEVFAHGLDDGQGNSYFALGDGLDYVYLIGIRLSQIGGNDFIV